MPRHVRPISQFSLAKLRLFGSGRVNGRTTHHQGYAEFTLPKLGLQGTARTNTLAGAKQANGVLTLGKLSLFNGAAIARRRAVSQGVSQAPLSKITLAATAQRIDSETAVVQLYNAQGNPSGYGPSNDPDGVFYGRTDLQSGDVWWASTVPANCTVAPLAGGSFTLTVGSGVTPGSYSFTWTLRANVGGVRTTGTKPFTVT